ncbi:16S rRNA (cytidine(1402)-2'-O)-methyltransferase [Desmospora profundinema]|uniref:Ribosomal RNA small subunit methyltransferase I n=1 Tax=Desmospora profundinema TaxID=1571184 RepID=A0ABU1IQQ6_9BACL|nr:16S rRNA (cytidine(1402)-2'-O)-methyltransferase [Desmospora profundinema]MDR6227131.1 16S rRNA (cytidine1402-2'-O)-methyltransferase [Desmospora profundinema]
MDRQKSFEENGGGKLYVVGTPIGNLGDGSRRMRDVLAAVDGIACEDTRHTRKLLTHLGLSSSLISYHEHNRHKRGEELIRRMLEGETFALVSDAGMPALSDPGEELVRDAIEAGIPVVSIPGPNAALAAVVASGLPPQPFLFIGFLPRNNKERVRELERWKRVPATLLFYESPHRVTAMLKDVSHVLGNRPAAMVRELTKRHEEWLRGDVNSLLSALEETGVRGELTLVVSGADPDAEQEDAEPSWWAPLSIIQHVDYHIDQGLSKKEAIQRTARERSVPKRDVYNTYHRAT